MKRLKIKRWWYRVTGQDQKFNQADAELLLLEIQGTTAVAKDINKRKSIYGD